MLPTLFFYEKSARKVVWKLSDWGLCITRDKRLEGGWRHGRCLARLPVHWLSLLLVAECQSLSGCCLPGISGTGTRGQLPLGSPGLVAAFNALWREDIFWLRICSQVSAKVPVLQFHPVDWRVWKKVAGLQVSRKGRKELCEFLVLVCHS